MRLFISYSRDDKAWVQELWRLLRDRAQHDAWIDQCIVPAQDWWDSILTNVEQADCIVYVMTPKSVASIYCLAEVHYAVALNKPIIPLMLKFCTYPDVLKRQRIQYGVINDTTTLGDALFLIERGLGEIRVGQLQGKYVLPDPCPSRPDEPNLLRQPEQVAEVFMLAEEAAFENNFTLAEKMFQRVIEVDPNGYGVVAGERLGEVRYERQRNADYLNIVQMLANPVLRKGALALWRMFVSKYGAVYDPQDVASQLTEPEKNPGRLGDQHVTVSDVARTSPASLGRDRVVDLLPVPFAWIEIPAGRVAIDQHGEFDVAAFEMAKYPVTNAQYALFLDAGGYREPEWWTNAGWEARKLGWMYNRRKRKWGPTGNPWIEPSSWQNAKFNGLEQPVVGVSWYEALAFCRWLGETSGEVIMLPTEQQWQRAAQGDDGRKYPWGNDWDGARCNNSVKPNNSDRTMPVLHYEGRGDSPFGVVDMAGNAWEWCLTAHESGSNELDGMNRRVLRGGSWAKDYTVFFSTLSRYRFHPQIRSSEEGFRCARSR